MNAAAVIPPALDFHFDDSQLQTEVAATQAVWKEYMPGLESGNFDPNVYYPKFIDARNQAGQQKIMEELKKQLADWVAKNGQK